MATHLALEPLAPAADALQAAATLHREGRPPLRLWWRLPAEWRHALTPWADPFIVGLLFPMMEARQAVRVEGLASPSLLENLEHYMAIWSVWGAGRYRPVDIRANQELEAPCPATDTVLCPFSGGSDSAFTLLRHVRRDAGRRSRTIGAAVIMDGFDVWHSQANSQAIFQGIRAGALAQLAPLSLPAILMDSNFHELPLEWGHAFGTHLISGLRLLAGQFRGTLIPNNHRYNAPSQIWGSTPLIDRYLSSLHFPVIDDGGEVHRSDKLRYISQSPGMLEHLRVCFPANGRHENCGLCEKCVRNLLCFRIAGLTIPSAAFPHQPTLRQVARMKFHSPMNVLIWEELLKHARSQGLGRDPWVRAMAAAVRRGHRRHQLQQLKKRFVPLRNRLRTLFRGSPENRHPPVTSPD